MSWLLLHLLHITVATGRVELSHVEALVDAAWNGLDVGHQLVFDGLQVESVLWCDQVDGQAQVTKPPWESENVFNKQIHCDWAHVIVQEELDS